MILHSTFQYILKESFIWKIVTIRFEWFQNVLCFNLRLTTLLHETVISITS